MKETISPRSGTAFLLPRGAQLKIIDPMGEQVCDLLCFSQQDKREALSSGRTIDYNNKIFFSEGDKFYSNRSEVMFEILGDTVGRHDFLLTPCSSDTFRIIYGHDHPHRGCFGNLEAALKEYGITGDDIPTTFNVFMNVTVNGETGEIKVEPPKSKAGDYIIIRAEMDLIVGLTACSAEQSNNYSFKPIEYQILNP
ncbi:MAG: urea carboxylase-associated family protein [Proteobacteria bacterium]|nr:MAG: urea carboxylase-associated family protein [Pseudomonadota bacterium]